MSSSGSQQSSNRPPTLGDRRRAFLIALFRKEPAADLEISWTSHSSKFKAFHGTPFPSDGDKKQSEHPQLQSSPGEIPDANTLRSKFLSETRESESSSRGEKNKNKSIARQVLQGEEIEAGQNSDVRSSCSKFSRIFGRFGSNL